MIPNFKTYIKESVWGNISKRAEGTLDRKEDNIDNLNGKEFCTYLTHRYEVVDAPNNEILSYSQQPDIIQIPICYKKKNLIMNGKKHECGKVFNIQIWSIDKPDKIKLCITGDIFDEGKELCQKLKEEYWITRPNFFWANIIPRIPGSPSPGTVTNTFIIKVIDFILENPTPYKPIIIKK